MFWFSGGVQLTTMLVTSGRTWRELGTSGTRVSGKENRKAGWYPEPLSFRIFHHAWEMVFSLLPNYLGLSFFHFAEEFRESVCTVKYGPWFYCSLRKQTQTAWNTKHCSINLEGKRKRSKNVFPMEKNKYIVFQLLPIPLGPTSESQTLPGGMRKAHQLIRSLLSTGDQVSYYSNDINYLLPKVIW